MCGTTSAVDRAVLVDVALNPGHHNGPLPTIGQQGLLPNSAALMGSYTFTVSGQDFFNMFEFVLDTDDPDWNYRKKQVLDRAVASLLSAVLGGVSSLLVAVVVCRRPAPQCGGIQQRSTAIVVQVVARTAGACGRRPAT